MLFDRLIAFPPICSRESRVLILGSMPGAASLSAQRYYAHPQNSFWKILGSIFDFDPECNYEDRVATLLRCKVAVWDVLLACAREGSLDSAIVRESEVANDFDAFFTAQPFVDRVYFNGTMAESLFKRHCKRHYDDSRLKFLRLPSTSPANAGVRYEEKLAAWRGALNPQRSRF